MKIAEVIATFPPYHGGMGYVCFQNSRDLAARGHDVTVFTLDHGSHTYERDPEYFKVVRLRTPFIYGDGGPVPQLYPKLKGFDIVHLHYPFFGGAEYVYASSLFRGQPYFLTYHLDVFGSSLLKRLMIGTYEPIFMKRIIGRASLIGALSHEHLKNSAASQMVDWDRVVEIPNGVDVERFQPREREETLLKKHGLEGKTVVLFVGNLQPFKGLHILIEALSRIEDEKVVLLVVGGGYGERKYRKLVKETGLGERVIFAGPKSQDDDLPFYYNLCDFLVLPSSRSEAFPLVVLEAMASGKPVIVSSLPGPSRLVEEERDGLVARIDDAEDLKMKIGYLTREKERCQAMGRAAREKVVRQYRWADAGRKLEKALLDIMKNPRT
jgi:glycosyltransferase involved in cell wall biosynthesis